MDSGKNSAVYEKARDDSIKKGNFPESLRPARISTLLPTEFDQDHYMSARKYRWQRHLNFFTFSLFK